MTHQAGINPLIYLFILPFEHKNQESFYDVLMYIFADIQPGLILRGQHQPGEEPGYCSPPF